MEAVWEKPPCSLAPVSCDSRDARYQSAFASPRRVGSNAGASFANRCGPSLRDNDAREDRTDVHPRVLDETLERPLKTRSYLDHVDPLNGMRREAVVAHERRKCRLDAHVG